MRCTARDLKRGIEPWELYSHIDVDGGFHIHD